jgi:hypothetical protein
MYVGANYWSLSSEHMLTACLCTQKYFALNKIKYYPKKKIKYYLQMYQIKCCIEQLRYSYHKNPKPNQKTVSLYLKVNHYQ